MYTMSNVYDQRKYDYSFYRLDPNPEYWEGKRGACVGVLQLIAAHDDRASLEQLSSVLSLLRNSHNPQAEQIAKVMRRFAKETNISL